MNDISVYLKVIELLLSYLTGMGIGYLIIIMYKHKKKKPVKTGTYCKRSKKFLTDQEVFYGKCYGCSATVEVAQKNCIQHVKS